ERNVISGNAWEGVGIYDVGTSHNLLAGNWIGVDVTGAIGVPNLKGGITFFNGSSDNAVGTIDPAVGNVIAFNAADGVEIANPATLNNSIVSNSIYANVDLGIDLGPNGVTPNDLTPPPDADSGPDNLQNSPVLIAAQLLDDGRLSVSYSVPSDPTNSRYP